MAKSETLNMFKSGELCRDPPQPGEATLAVEEILRIEVEARRKIPGQTYQVLGPSKTTLYKNSDGSNLGIQQLDRVLGKELRRNTQVSLLLVRYWQVSMQRLPPCIQVFVTTVETREPESGSELLDNIRILEMAPIFPQVNLLSLSLSRSVRPNLKTLTSPSAQPN